jgi:hypothetical protein
MRKIALPEVVVVTSMAVAPLVAKAEPVMLTASQMDSVTAAALIEVNIPINILVQTNLTTQVANAIALAFATCGVCTGAAPSASSLASAVNANVSGQR